MAYDSIDTKLIVSLLLKLEFIIDVYLSLMFLTVTSSTSPPGNITASASMRMIYLFHKIRCSISFLFLDISTNFN